MKIKNNKIVLLISLTFLPVNLAFANEWKMETSWPTSPTGAELSSQATISELINYFYEWAVILGVILVFGMLIYASFRYIISAGDATKINAAKDKLSSAFLGLILLFGSWILMSVLNPELTLISKITMPSVDSESSEFEEIDIKKENTCDYAIIDFNPRGEDEIKKTLIKKGEIRNIKMEPLSSIACQEKEGVSSDKNKNGKIRFVEARTVSEFGTWDMTGSDLRNPICDIDCAEKDNICEEEIFIDAEEINYKYCYDHRELALGFTGSVKYISQKPDPIGTTCLAGDQDMREGGGCSLRLYKTKLTTRCGNKITSTTPKRKNLPDDYDEKVNCIDLNDQ